MLKSRAKKLPMNSTATKVQVSTPETIEIKLVQANDLRQHSILYWLLTLTSTIAASFWVAFTTEREVALLWSAVSFTLFFGILLGLIIYSQRKRRGTVVTREVSLDDFVTGKDLRK